MFLLRLNLLGMVKDVMPGFPLLPRPLGPDSHIRVVSPASPIEPERIEGGIRLLEEAGYRVSLGEHVFDRHFYLAGSDKDRASDLMEAIADQMVDAIIFSRGGYGCARLMQYLDIPQIVAARKPICGFSDITTLHLALNRAGLVTLHTPMLLTFNAGREPWVAESLRAILRGENPIVEFAPRAETLVPGTAQGILTGGCLCLLTDSMGTPYELDCAGRIVLVEDVDESPHRIDAMLTHLINCGKLQTAAGIVVGEMTGSESKADPTIGDWSWRRIVEDRIVPLGIPAVVNFPFGHMRNMLSLPLGVRARLDADAGLLKILEPFTSAR